MDLNSRAQQWSPVMLSILRIVTALVFMAHGTQKILGIPASKFPVEMFSMPWTAGMLELVGGALLIVGLFTRPVAFILSGEMAVAYFLAHAPKSFYPAENGGDAAILFCFIFLYIAAAGPGPLSVDAQMRRGSTI